MTWFDSIYDLQYYSTVPGIPCYCEELVYPNDMQLQGSIYNGSGSYSLNLYVMSADGLTTYEDATAYFDYYFAKMPDGTHFFNTRLKSYSPAMCAHKCFLIHAVVTQNGGIAVFDKYTERYCQANCCNVASGITYSQDLLLGGGDSDTSLKPPVAAAPQLPVSDCGDPLIRIISTFDCMDEFNGVYYAIPDSGNVLSGTASFGYIKITSCRGRIVQRPREIKREVSYNCRLQYAESQPTYQLEAFEYFPAWKMAEIEGQLLAEHIWIDDYKTYKEYQFNGGTAFKQISKCFEYFKLDTAVQDCTQRQVFGCGDCSNSADVSRGFLAVPESYAGGGFFNDSKQLIASDTDGLMIWLRSQDGVSNVEAIEADTIPCPVQALFRIEGKANIPTSVYYDAPLARNRSFLIRTDSTDGICGKIGYNTCAKPVNGTIVVNAMVCDTPVNGDVIVAAIDTTLLTISGFDDWTIDTVNTFASLYERAVTFSIRSVNTAVVAASGDVYSFGGEIIGYMSAEGRPSVTAVLNNENSSSMPAGTFLTIEPTGAIRFSGDITIATANTAVIQLSNLQYSL